MNGPNHATRRTALKMMAAALVGGSVVPGTAGATREGPVAEANGRRNELEIVAQHDHDADEHLFELDTDEVGSGWTTLRFDNQTDHTHFAYLARLPQAAIDEAGDRDLLDFYVEHVTQPFQWFMDTLVEGKEPDPDDLSDRYSNVEEEVIFPPWFERVLPSGGVGLTSGGEMTTSTVHLDSGEYIVECYVKDSEEDFHSYLGMIDQFTVTDGQSGAPDPGPETTFDLSLSTDGIDAPESVQPGQHTVAVHVENQRIYEHLLGHDVHLINLDGSTTVEEVSDWTNWMAPGGLVSDESDPGPFVGGVQTILTPDLLAGTGSETAYVHVTLEQGEYAWVSEVPAPNDKGLLQTFSVTESARSGRYPPADPGDSRNWGPAGEHPEDDLSERMANSALPDEFKTMFDAFANHDPDDFG